VTVAPVVVVFQLPHHLRLKADLRPKPSPAQVQKLRLIGGVPVVLAWREALQALGADLAEGSGVGS
jgi:hypothetical protein